MNITTLQILIQREQGFGDQGCRIGNTVGWGGGVQNLFLHQNHFYFEQGALMESKRLLLIRKL